MTLESRAAAALEIATGLQGRLALDIHARTTDPIEQAALASAVIGVVLRRCLKAFVLPVDRETWLGEIVRMVVT